VRFRISKPDFEISNWDSETPIEILKTPDEIPKPQLRF
jgi:hypothetical protein